MITRKQAEKAKETLLLKLRNPDWLSGVALGLSGSGVSVRVAINQDVTDAILAQIPKSVNGVDVIVERAIESVPFDPRWLKNE